MQYIQENKLSEKELKIRLNKRQRRYARLNKDKIKKWNKTTYERRKADPVRYKIYLKKMREYKYKYLKRKKLKNVIIEKYE